MSKSESMTNLASIGAPNLSKKALINPPALKLEPETKATRLIKKLNEINEGYIAINFGPDTMAFLDSIYQGAKNNKAITGELERNPVDDLHCTLMYSKSTPVLEIIPVLRGQTIEAHNLRYSLFGKENDVLVIEFDCDILQQFHQEYKDSGQIPDGIGANEYRPHITLVSGVKSMDIDKLPPLPQYFPLQIRDHYSEEIKKD